MDDFIGRQPKLLVALVATAIHGVLYMLPNHLQVFPVHELPLSPTDRAVPFVPWTAWIYWSDYLLVFVAFWGMRAKGSAAQFVYAVLTAIALATVVHWVYPTVYPRALFPIPPDTDPVTAFLFGIFRQLDSPASCLPSLHVATSVLAALAAFVQAKRRGALLLVWACAVAVATLTAKQHFFVDVVTGAALAFAVAAVFYGRQVWARASAAHSRMDLGAL